VSSSSRERKKGEGGPLSGYDPKEPAAHPRPTKRKKPVFSREKGGGGGHDGGEVYSYGEKRGASLFSSSKKGKEGGLCSPARKKRSLTPAREKGKKEGRIHPR